MHFFRILPILAFLAVFNLQAQISETFELTFEGAELIMASAQAFARDNNAPGGAIAIVDAGGHLILLHRLTGTFPIASEVACGKARTAALFKMPSKNLEDGILNGRTSLLSVGENMLRGGLPIVYKGKVIGAIGVSGAASADQDVQIAQAGLTAELLNQ